MIENDYTLAWGLYAVAALGCLLVGFKLTGWMWRWLREPLRVVLAVLLLTPTVVDPVGQLRPAIAITTLDVAFKVGNNAWRAVSDFAMYGMIAFALCPLRIAALAAGKARPRARPRLRPRPSASRPKMTGSAPRPLWPPSAATVTVTSHHLRHPGKWPGRAPSVSGDTAMCELLGMSANVPTDIVFSFTGLMQRGGRTGRTAMAGASAMKGAACACSRTRLPAASRR